MAGGREQEQREGERSAEEVGRSVVYCIVPRELARKLHEPLRRHFRDEPNVEVIVERRGTERRCKGERRQLAAEDAPAPAAERRLIRNAAGRRVGDQRAAPLPVEPPSLPRLLRRHTDRLVFVQRQEPSGDEPEDLDSARLITRIQAGDSEAFGLVYMRYFDRIYAYLRILLNDSHEAEDAAQQVFMRSFESMATYERRAGYPFRAWLFVVARNVALSQLAKLKRIDLVDPFQMPERHTSAAAEDDLPALDWISDKDLVIFVERLPLAQRQVLLLRYMLDLSYADIASVLDRTEADVRTLQSRGVRFLRARLAALGRDSRRSGRMPMRSPLKRAPVAGARRWALYG